MKSNDDREECRFFLNLPYFSKEEEEEEEEEGEGEGSKSKMVEHSSLMSLHCVSRTIQYLHRCSRTIQYLHRFLKTKDLCVENNTIFT